MGRNQLSNLVCERPRTWELGSQACGMEFQSWARTQILEGNPDPGREPDSWEGTQILGGNLVSRRESTYWREPASGGNLPPRRVPRTWEGT